MKKKRKHNKSAKNTNQRTRGKRLSKSKKENSTTNEQKLQKEIELLKAQLNKENNKRSQSKSHKHKSQKKDEEEKIEEGLKYIYEIDKDEKEDGRDMSKLEAVKSPILRRILLSTLLILIAVAAGLAGAFLISNPMASSDSELTFDINTQDEPIISGQEAEITIPYNNPSQSPLANLEVTIQMPKNFVFLESTPEPFNKKPLTWHLGTLDIAEKGEIKIKGIFNEPPGTAVTIQAITRYMPANFSSPFEDINTKSIMIEDSIFRAEITGPEKAIPGEEQTYEIKVSQISNTDEPINNTELELQIPKGFTISDNSEAPKTENTPIWSIEKLTKDEPFSLTIKGQFASDVSGEQSLKAIVNTVISNNTIKQYEATTETDVLASDLSLSLIINGESGDTILMPGKDLAINVALANKGEEASEEIKVELFVDKGLDRLKLDKREALPKGDVYDNKINWDKTDMERLKTLLGGEEASIDLSIPTAETGETEIIIHAEATIKTVAGVEINRFIESSKIKIRVAADLQANASARYYESDGLSVGTGPIPPEVGQETSYRVTWTVANAQNDAEDIVMTANLPQDAKWSGLVSASKGTLHYDQIANRIRWAIGDLNAGDPPPVATFDIKVKPRESSLNKFIDILEEAIITGFDKSTNAKLSTSTPAITSEIPNDPKAADKGIVIDPTKEETEE